MSSIESKYRILEAIDELRRRKARPDSERICKYIIRQYSVNSEEARNDLDWCVANNYVLKVKYKGDISYRIAATKNAQPHRNVDEKKTILSCNLQDKAYKTNRFTELLTRAFGELILRDPDYLEMGIPGIEIINNILAKDKVRYTKNYICILLEKEVEKGELIKTENGNYLMGPSKEEENLKNMTKDWKRDGINVIANEVSKGQWLSNNGYGNHLFIQETNKYSEKEYKNDRYKEMDSSKNSEDKNKSYGKFSTGGRRKRAKKVFDPSDNHVPKKRGRPLGSLNRSTVEKELARQNNEDSPENLPQSRISTSGRDKNGVCYVCGESNDGLIACRDCTNRAHLCCLSGKDMMLKMYADNTFQCPHCKTCEVCFETSDAGHLIVCSECADGYHANCHQPRIIQKIRNSQKWMCANCQMPDKYDISSSNSDDSSSSYTSPSLSPPLLSPQTGGWVSPDDATHWTADEVYKYFAQYFPEEAKIFKEQEIDGRSLLLLTRIDVLTNLNLKLRPALKIYKHVVKLQLRRADYRLYWW